MAEFFVNAAVLHVFDYASDMTVFSKRSMNLEDTVIESYVNKQVAKIMKDIGCKKGYFLENSPFLEQFQTYCEKQCNFIDFSLRIAHSFEEYIRNSATGAYDVLFVDYLYEDVPYIALMVLENQMAYTHLTKTDGDMIENTIVQQRSVLPTPTKKIRCYAYINTVTKEIHFCDSLDWNIEDSSILQEKILCCTCEKSNQEILKEVDEVVKEVALKADTNPTLLLSKYKNYMKESIEEETPVTTEALATNVFNETEEMQNAFISTSLEHDIPKEVEMPKHYAQRKLKNQKIKTDTGIELTFPTEYSENSHFIEFVNKSDGTISIEIKNVGKITNKG